MQRKSPKRTWYRAIYKGDPGTVMDGRCRQHGAVLVESALTIGVLFLLLFAIMDLGRAYNMYQVLTDAAREGARYSVAPDPSASYAVPSAPQIQSEVQRFMAADHIHG